MSTVIISLPTNIENGEVSGKTLIRGFICANNRLAFDSYILLPKNKHGAKITKLKVLHKIRNAKKKKRKMFKKIKK